MRALMIAQLKLIRTAPVLTKTARWDDWKSRDFKRRKRSPPKPDIRLRRNIGVVGHSASLRTAEKQLQC